MQKQYKVRHWLDEVNDDRDEWILTLPFWGLLIGLGVFLLYLFW